MTKAEAYVWMVWMPDWISLGDVEHVLDDEIVEILDRKLNDCTEDEDYDDYYAVFERYCRFVTKKIAVLN